MNWLSKNLQSSKGVNKHHMTAMASKWASLTHFKLHSPIATLSHKASSCLRVPFSTWPLTEPLAKNQPSEWTRMPPPEAHASQNEISRKGRIFWLLPVFNENFTEEVLSEPDLEKEIGRERCKSQLREKILHGLPIEYSDNSIFSD